MRTYGLGWVVEQDSDILGEGLSDSWLGLMSLVV